MLLGFAERIVRAAMWALGGSQGDVHGRQTTPTIPNGARGDFLCFHLTHEFGQRHASPGGKTLRLGGHILHKVRFRPWGFHGLIGLPSVVHSVGHFNVGKLLPKITRSKLRGADTSTPADRNWLLAGASAGINRDGRGPEKIFEKAVAKPDQQAEKNGHDQKRDGGK